LDRDTNLHLVVLRTMQLDPLQKQLLVPF